MKYVNLVVVFATKKTTRYYDPKMEEYFEELKKNKSPKVQEWIDTQLKNYFLYSYNGNYEFSPEFKKRIEKKEKEETISKISKIRIN